MKTAKLNDYLEYDEKLFQVTGIAEGKTLILTPVEEDNGQCPHCGGMFKGLFYILESCSNFQKGAKPVKTIKG